MEAQTPRKAAVKAKRPDQLPVGPLLVNRFNGLRLDAAFAIAPWDIPAEAFVVPLGPRGQGGETAIAIIEMAAWLGMPASELQQRIMASLAHQGPTPALIDQPILMDTTGLPALIGPRRVILATAYDPEERIDHTRCLRRLMQCCAAERIASLALPVPAVGLGASSGANAATNLIVALETRDGPLAPERITLTSQDPHAFRALHDRRLRLAEQLAAQPYDATVRAILAAAFDHLRPLPATYGLALDPLALLLGIVRELSPKGVLAPDSALPAPLRAALRGLQGRREDIAALREGRVALIGAERASLTSEAADILDRAVAPSGPMDAPALLRAILASPDPFLQAALDHLGIVPDAVVPPPFRPLIPGIGADDVGAGTPVDCLGAEAEAEAFARLIAAEGVRPPIAIGVFGAWGSGKSFFLKLLQRGVEAKQGKPSYHPGIVQIRFNAWHYVDTSLWASLVAHIFGELDRWMLERQQGTTDPATELFERLATARSLSLEAARQLRRRRKEMRDATGQLASAETSLAQAMQQAAPTPAELAAASWTTLIGAEPAKAPLLDQAMAALRLLGAEATSAKLGDAGAQAAATKAAADRLLESGTAALDQARPLVRQIGLGATALHARLPAKGWPRRLALGGGAVGLVAVPTLGVFAVQAALGPLPAALAAVASGLTATAGTLTWAQGRIQGAVERLRTFRDTLDAAIAARIDATATEEARRRLAAAQAAEAEARRLLAITTERAAEAARLFDAGTGRSRLYRFVRERAGAEDYRRHVGLVAAVRRDFEELAAAMAAAGADGEVTERAERHRRLHEAEVEALIAEAGDLLHAEEQQKLREGIAAANATPDAATSFQRIVLYIDDLDRCPAEKVVEVLQAVHLLLTFPLFVAVVAADIRWVSRALQRHYPELLDGGAPWSAGDGATPYDYLEKIFQIPYWVRPMTAEAAVRFLESRVTALDGVLAAAPPPTPVAATPMAEEPEEQPESEVPPEPDATPMPVATAAPPPPPIAAWLSLDAAERAFMAQLAPFLGASPRQVLRFLNVYRVIRGSLPESALAEFMSGGYRAVMVHLALGCAGEPAEGAEAALLKNLQDKPATDILARWAPVAARYSFSG